MKNKSTNQGRFDIKSTVVVYRERGVITVQSAVYRCADTQTCSQTGTQDIKNSCDGRKVCDINMNIISTSDPSVCTYLDTTFNCVPESEGQIIVVYWANFGRRDNTTCPDGRPDSQLQNVHCSSPNSTEYVTNRCNWQNSCTVGASNTVFGDPCGGTYKYLEVVYDCQAPSCPPGWTWFGGRCFIFDSSKKIWTDAESSCETLSGHLASFHSTAEYTFIRELTHTAAGPNKRTWVGGRENVSETVWMWSDGSQFDFIIWGSEQPDNSGGEEDCMEINHEGGDPNDAPCDDNKAFVCVRDP
ncbi:lymphocyte antigen 75-like [Pelmatolapia mariae]|uniref:lymphocyte antigen 75-like n=1 Tax=Pelmatolapia mariae TaxID=158779 RepID=UPI002FE51855